jgi:mannose-1-phosphate guanylyltransferase
MREYTSLGTAGGLYHFRDAILKGNPNQIFVIHADICFSYPLEEMQQFHENHRGVGTIMGVKVPRESATKYGCIVTNQQTHQALHYVEKPDSYISDTINGGVYLFDKSIFDEIKNAMDARVKRIQEDPLSQGLTDSDDEDQLRLEQDVLAPLASEKKLYVFMTPGYWRQIKSAG